MILIGSIGYIFEDEKEWPINMATPTFGNSERVTHYNLVMLCRLSTI